MQTHIISSQQLIIFYIFFWVVHINGCIRRGRQPLLRGTEWFFSVHVQPDFYTSIGRKLLHRYWMRMSIPFALGIPIAMTIFMPGYLQYAVWLIVAQAALIHLNHSYSVDLAERQARPFAVLKAEQPVASVALSLTPRRLRDYRNRKVEWVLALCNVVALAWLVRYYFASPDHHNLCAVFGIPSFCLYAQVGMLLVKRAVLAWRTPVPQDQAAEHLEAREETRKYYLKVCDWYRAAAAAGALFWPLVISSSPATFNRLKNFWLASWFVITVVGTVWVEFKRKQLVKVALRARPVKMPDLLHQSDIARWPVCYQPSAPMLILRGARGYSLNLANTLARLGAAYLAGMVVLIAFLRMSR